MMFFIPSDFEEKYKLKSFVVKDGEGNLVFDYPISEQTGTYLVSESDASPINNFNKAKVKSPKKTKKPKK